MDNRELLKKLTRGEITREELDPTPWLYVATTSVKGEPVAQDIFATKEPGIPCEGDRVTPKKATEIRKLPAKGIFGATFSEKRDFKDTPEPWAPFQNTEKIAFNGKQHPPTMAGAMIPSELLKIS